MKQDGYHILNRMLNESSSMRTMTRLITAIQKKNLKLVKKFGGKAQSSPDYKSNLKRISALKAKYHHHQVMGGGTRTAQRQMKRTTRRDFGNKITY